MLTFLATLLAAPIAQAAASQSAGRTAPDVRAPSEIVAAAPAVDWTAISPGDLLVMDLAPDAAGRARRVVIQLMPAPFSQGWIGNIRKLAAAHWWDGLSINRVQDNYVAQWGDADGEDKAKAKALPAGLATVPQAQYEGFAPPDNLPTPKSFRREGKRVKFAQEQGSYSAAEFILDGWPIAESADKRWPVHCYGMVGVGRNLSPDTGSGAELYTVIGHAPRHLDRNIALVGRVVEGIEHLSSMPRGTEPLGFYKTGAERTPILRIRLATDLPAAERPRFEYLSTDSTTFARYADARANRRDAFFIRPAGGADICNVPVPVRRAQ